MSAIIVAAVKMTAENNVASSSVEIKLNVKRNNRRYDPEIDEELWILNVMLE